MVILHGVGGVAVVLGDRVLVHAEVGERFPPDGAVVVGHGPGAVPGEIVVTAVVTEKR